MKKGTKVFLIVLSVIVSIVIGFVAFLLSAAYTKQYVTNDISDYGNYIGNYNNKKPREYINSFFPEKIENYFEDVKYSYRAQKGDTYAYEAYLEFSIADNQKFQEYIAEVIGNRATNAFKYDDKYMECVLDDIFDPNYPDEYTSNFEIHISDAKIGKIIFSYEEQKVIFVAIGVYDGGMATTDFLCVYFERFNIAPWEYALDKLPEDKKDTVSGKEIIYWAEFLNEKRQVQENNSSVSE